MKTFTDIITHDYRKPLKERLAARKYCGPYHHAPRDTTKSNGFGFYCASEELAMDKHGSICNLRLKLANDVISYSSLSRISGYYIDNHQDETLKPIIAILPHGKGFLAGWTLGQGMCAELGCYIYDNEQGAAMAAHVEAEYTAERWLEASETEELT